MFEALAQQRASAIAGGVHDPVRQPGRADPADRSRRRRQQQSHSESVVDGTGEHQQADGRAEGCRDRVPDEQSEGHAGQCPAPNPNILAASRQTPQARSAVDH